MAADGCFRVYAFKGRGLAEQKNSLRRRKMGWVAWLVLIVVVLLVGGIAAGPSLVPSGYLSRQIAAELRASTGREVEVRGASLGWFSGLQVDDIRIACYGGIDCDADGAAHTAGGSVGSAGGSAHTAGGSVGSADGLALTAGGPAHTAGGGKLSSNGSGLGGAHSVVHIQDLSLSYEPWEMPGALLGAAPSFGRARIGRLSLGVVRGADGRLNLPEGGEQGPPPEFDSIEVLDGEIDFLDEGSGLRRRLSGLKLKMGRLARGQKAYLTGSAGLHSPRHQPGSLPTGGIISINGLADHLDLRNLQQIIGGCDVQWESVNLGDLVPPLARSGVAVLVDAPTDGKVSLTISAGELIGFDGSLSLSKLVVSQDGSQHRDLAAEQMAVSFIGSYNRTSGLTVIRPLQISGSGSSLRLEGAIESSAGGLLNGHVGISGIVSWTPLKEVVPSLARSLASFQTATGTAHVRQLDVEIVDSVASVKGLIDLGRSELVLEPVFQKQSDRAAVLTIDAALDLVRGTVDVAEVSLLLAPPSVPMEGEAAPSGDVRISMSTGGREVPLGAGGEAKAVVLTIDVPDIRLLPRHVPVSGEVIRQLEATGALAVEALIFPSVEGIPAQVTVDAAGLSLRTSADSVKPAGEPLSLQVMGLLQGAHGQAEGRLVSVRLGEGETRWAGRAYGEPGTASSAERLIIEGRLDVRETGQWQKLLRPLLPPAGPSVGLVGNLSAQLECAIDENEIDLKAHVDAGRAAIEVAAAAGGGRLFVKPLGRPMEIDGRVSINRGEQRLTVSQRVSLGANRLVLDLVDVVADELQVPQNARVDRSVGSAVVDQEALRRMAAQRAGGASLSVALEAGRVEEVLELLPQVSAALSEYNPSGALRLKLTGRTGLGLEDRLLISGEIDATGLTYGVPGHLTKQAGLHQTLDFVLRIPQRGESELDVVELQQLDAQLGGSTMAMSGEVSFNADVGRVASRFPTMVLTVHEVGLKGKVLLVQDAELQAFSHWWDEFSSRHDLKGRATLDVAVRGSRRGGSLEFSADASEASFRYGQDTEKRRGVPASFKARIASGEQAGLLNIIDARLDLGDSYLTCGGTLYSGRRVPFALEDIAGAELRIEADSRRLNNLAELLPLPGLAQLRPRGALTTRLYVAADRYGLTVEEGEFSFDNLELDFRGTPLSLTGELELSRQRLQADGLKIRADGSTVVLAADIASPLDSPRGSLAISGTYFNLDRLLQALGAVPQSAEGGKELEGAGGGEAAVAAGVTIDGRAEVTVAAADEEAELIPSEWPQISRYLSSSNISGAITIDNFIWKDELGVVYDWQAFSTEFRLSEGRLDVHDFKAVWRGGVVNGAVGIDFEPANPLVHTRYNIRNIAAGEAIQPLINHQFPDMVVKGAINQVYDARENLFATAASPSYPVGATLFEASDGSMSGPAAPQWLTDLIPGLKLTTYNFSRMQSIGRLEADGRSVNQMLFDGSPYSLFIDGQTMADGAAVYVLGVDLMNSLERGDATRSLEQGRVPLMEFKGRIVDSAWEDLEVRFKLPHEVAYDVLLRRNLLVRLLDKSGVPQRPDFTPYRFQGDGGSGDGRRPAPAEQ